MITIGVLALQGAFLEHLTLLKRAAKFISQDPQDAGLHNTFDFIEVRNPDQLSRCNALIIPGGESTTISLVAAQSSLLDPLRKFVKVDRKPTWGTCAGLILLAEAADATKKGGQDLIGGLDIRVNRNHFGRQIESFEAPIDLPFLKKDQTEVGLSFRGIFIRAPVVEKILPNKESEQAEEKSVEGTVIAPSRQAKDDVAKSAMSQNVEILALLPGRIKKAQERIVEGQLHDHLGDIVAVKQGNVFGTSFHPELTTDIRIHVWWLREVSLALNKNTILQ